jgi:hypothetical protein
MGFKNFAGIFAGQKRFDTTVAAPKGRRISSRRVHLSFGRRGHQPHVHAQPAMLCPQESRRCFQGQRLAAGGEGGMTPFVVESTGRLGPSALKFLKEVKSDFDAFHLTNFISTVSACCALYMSLMVANARRRLHERELVIFDW